MYRAPVPLRKGCRIPTCHANGAHRNLPFFFFFFVRYPTPNPEVLILYLRSSIDLSDPELNYKEAYIGLSTFGLPLLVRQSNPIPISAFSTPDLEFRLHQSCPKYFLYCP
jgi:hypothetical protein